MRSVLALVVGAVSALALVLPSAAAAAEDACGARVLVLGAMPLEVQPLLAEATVDPADVVRVSGRTFYLGELAGHDAIIAMTGIGLVNAEQTVTVAFEELGCDITGVVFSGVAGSVLNIGDVAVPERWTVDGGETFVAADPAMLAAAASVADQVELSKAVPVGDDACACPGVDTIDTPVVMPHQPVVAIGGDGTSADTFNGNALPCIPGGGDTFGCQPCLAPGSTAQDAADFAVNAPDTFSPDFITGFFTPPGETTGTYASQDMESAAAAIVAQEYGAPFLAVRAVSDGEGDPLNLPGFPVQFFAYRHLAGDNAAAATVAILGAWEPEVSSSAGADDVDAAGAPDTPGSADAPRATDGRGALPATGGGAALLALPFLALAVAGRRRR